MQPLVLSEDELHAIIKLTAKAVADELRADLTKAKQKEVLTKAELAEYWNCSMATINRYMRYSKLPCLRYGDKDHPRFKRSEVDRWRERAKAVQGQAA
jgi:excisionase family DNA binding protein